MSCCENLKHYVDQHSVNFKMLLGLVAEYFKPGMSLDMIILKSYFSFQTRHSIEKVLDWENSHLYHKVSNTW